MPNMKKAKRRSHPLVAAPDQVGGRLQPATPNPKPGKRGPDSRPRGDERRKTAAPPDYDDNQPPPDTAEFRIALLRKIATVAGWWRRCRAPVCRRSRRCLGANLRCQHDQPRRPRTPEQEARIMAELKRELERRLGTG